MRLYLPATTRSLALLQADGTLPVDDQVVVAEGDSEDQEYDALMTAARSAGGLAAELGPGERRRVVVVAELAASDLPARIGLADVVAVHADMSEGAGPDDDLGWYALHEIPDLLRGN